MEEAAIRILAKEAEELTKEAEEEDEGTTGF
jgi:hypothetical protein